MFIKLTRIDNSPIWINASFVVTVEPRRQGGSVVVPIGDGLDYDVKESPAVVLDLLSGAPAPAVVPVPAPKGLTVTPEDVSPEAEPAEPSRPVEATPAAGAEPAVDAAPADETRPAKKPRTRKAKAAAEGGGDDTDAAKPLKKPRATRKAKKVELPLEPDQVERLVRMAPGSVRKLQNTLATQFKVENLETAVAALEAAGILSLDRDHVNWLKA